MQILQDFSLLPEHVALLVKRGSLSQTLQATIRRRVIEITAVLQDNISIVPWLTTADIDTMIGAGTLAGFILVAQGYRNINARMNATLNPVSSRGFLQFSAANLMVLASIIGRGAWTMGTNTIALATALWLTTVVRNEVLIMLRENIEGKITLDNAIQVCNILGGLMGVSIYTVDNQVVRWSPYMEKLLGCSQAEAVELSGRGIFFETLYPDQDTRADALTALQGVHMNGGFYEMNFSPLHRDGWGKTGDAMRAHQVPLTYKTCAVVNLMGEVTHTLRIVTST